ncbi:MAG: glycerol kinase GlpK [bacterium]
MSKAILALDQGTTSSRAIVFDRRGQIVASAQQEFAQHFPQPGWVEHDLEEIWQSQLATARRALAEAKLSARDVAAIGIANQRETAALWDRASGAPVAPAIVWQCRRTAQRCAQIREAGDEPMLREKTGLVADPYFSATKWEWQLDNLPGLRDRAERGELACGTIDSWLAYRLSGGALHITDPGNASRTLLFNLQTGAWDPELLRYFRLPQSLLPTVVPSSAPYGATDASLLGAPVTIAAIAGDQQAALFGQNCLEPGMMKNTYGTGCFLLVNTGTTPLRSHAGLLTSPAWRIGAETHYALEGSIFVAGAAVQWLRDGLQIIADAAETEALANSVADTGGVHFVPAFVGLGAPHWNPAARGALVGLTRGTTRAHIARAALEGIAFQTMELVEAVSRDMGGRPPVLRVDGGAAANNFLCRFQADLLGLPVERPAILETTALGAAYLAGLATGFWSDLSEIAALRRSERVFEPTQGDGWRADQAAQWKKAVERVAL